MRRQIPGCRPPGPRSCVRARPSSGWHLSRNRRGRRRGDRPARKSSPGGWVCSMHLYGGLCPYRCGVFLSCNPFSIILLASPLQAFRADDRSAMRSCAASMPIDSRSSRSLDPQLTSDLLVHVCMGLDGREGDERFDSAEAFGKEEHLDSWKASF